METAGNIRFLMQKHSVKNDGKTCNPAELFMFDADTGDSGVGVEANDQLGASQKSRVLDKATKALESTVGVDATARDLVVSKSSDTLFIQKSRSNEPKIDLPSIVKAMTPHIEKSIWDDFVSESK